MEQAYSLEDHGRRHSFDEQMDSVVRQRGQCTNICIHSEVSEKTDFIQTASASFPWKLHL